MPFISFRRRSDRQPRGLSAEERRFALGSRSLADLVAPAATELARDHLRLDHQYARTLVVTGYPRTVSPGWLSPLIDFEEPIEISLHLYPLESAQMVSTLTHKMVQLHSSRLMAERGGKLADPEREVAYEDAERLRDALQRGEERVFSVSLYLLAPGRLPRRPRRPDPPGGGALDGHARPVPGRPPRAGRAASAPACPRGRTGCVVYRNLDTSSLATTFPFSSATLSMERGVLYGIATHNHSPVLFDPFDQSLENANMVIFAKSGAGKSYFTKLMALRNLHLRSGLPGDRSRGRVPRPVHGGGRPVHPPRQLLRPAPQPLRPAGRLGQDDQEGRDPLAEQVASLARSPGADAGRARGIAWHPRAGAPRPRPLPDLRRRWHHRGPRRPTAGPLRSCATSTRSLLADPGRRRREPRHSAPPLRRGLARGALLGPHERRPGPTASSSSTSRRSSRSCDPSAST